VQTIDLTRLDIRSAAVYSFAHIWMADENLQEMFPFVFKSSRCGSFYDWLRSCGREDVRKWFALADVLNDSFHGANDGSHSRADEIMGY